MIPCLFCLKTFTTKSNLTRHQLSSKKCFSIQKESNPLAEHRAFTCHHCDKELVSKERLEYHLAICKNNELHVYKLSLDYRQFKDKDVLYFYEFNPIKSSNAIIIDNKNYYEFGVTSNIEQRDRTHNSDKNKSNTRLDKCIVFKSRSSVSDAERYLKRILMDMKLKVDYLKSNVCFMANDKELAIVYERMILYKEETPVTIEEQFVNNEMLKMKFNLYKQLYEDGKITLEQLSFNLNNA